MASILGIPEYDDSLAQESRRFNSSLIQQLGKQIQSDITTVQVNGQMRGLAQGLQQVNPDSPDFGKQTIGLMSQYPLAAQTPLGQAAINQLGAQHKFWQQEQLQNESPWRSGSGIMYNAKTGEYKQLPIKQAPGRLEKITGPGGVTRGFVNPQTGETLKLDDMGFEMPSTESTPKVGRYRTTADGRIMDSATGELKGDPQPKVLGTTQAKELAEVQGEVSRLADEIITNENAAKEAEAAYNGSSFNFLGAAGKTATRAREKASESYRALSAAKAKLESLTKAFRVAPVAEVTVVPKEVVVAPRGASAAQVEAAAALPVGPATETAVTLQSTKQLSEEDRLKVIQALKTKPREAVLKRLQEAGFDVTGL